MFGDLVVWYLFLGGAGAGVVTILAVLDLLVWRNFRLAGGTRVAWASTLTRRFFALGYGAAMIALMLGAACLLVDLGHPERFYYVLTHPTFSALTLGSYVLTAAILCSGVLGAIASFDTLRVTPRFMRALEVCAAFAGVAVMAYTGLFLSEIDFVPLWDNYLLPAVFVLSSLSIGLACVIGSALFETSARCDSVLLGLVRADTVVIILEIVCVFAYLASIACLQGRPDAVTAFLSGENGPTFWAGVVVLGMAAPLAGEVAYARKGAAVLPVLVLPCVIIGGYLLRYCIVNVSYL